MMGSNLIFVMVILCVMKHQSEATATLSMKLSKFVNTGDRKSDGTLTDSETNRGEPSFVICVDNVCGHSEPYSCRYALHRTTSVIVHAGAILNFPSDLRKLGGGVIPNPFNVSFTAWPGTVQLKIRVMEDDGGHLPSSHIDDMFDFIELFPASNKNTAIWHDRSLTGTRALYLDPTNLEYSVMLYCDDGFHGPYCDQVYGQSTCN